MSYYIKLKLHNKKRFSATNLKESALYRHWWEMGTSTDISECNNISGKVKWRQWRKLGHVKKISSTEVIKKCYLYLPGGNFHKPLFWEIIPAKWWRDQLNEHRAEEGTTWQRIPPNWQAACRLLKPSPITGILWLHNDVDDDGW